MRSVVVFERLTLDGVMQAPGRADDDRRGGLEHGGWATLWDPVSAGVAEESMASRPALLFGRRTYEYFYGFWPRQTDNSFMEVLNHSKKYVAVRRLVRTLMRHGLVDECVLLIHPLVLASGRRLFSDTGARAALWLVDAKASPSGVVIASRQSGAEDP